MASTIQVDKIQDTGGNTILSSNSTGTFTYEAASGANFTALDADNISAGTLAAARGGTGTTSYTAGVTEYDQWRTTTETAGSQTPVDNWARVADASFEKIGTGMSESSGVFTFPSTGIYLILAQSYCDGSLGASTYCGIQIFTTINDADYITSSESYDSVDVTGNHCAISCSHMVDVTDTANIKIKLRVQSQENCVFNGNSARTYTGMVFTRLGDT